MTQDIPYFLPVDFVNPTPLNDFDQKGTIEHDYNHYRINFKSNIKHTLIPIALDIFALFECLHTVFGGVKNLCTGSLSVSSIPHHCFTTTTKSVKAIIMCVLNIFQAIQKGLSSVCVATGFLAWHGLEKSITWYYGSTNTVLSRDFDTRHNIYQSIGTTILALGGVFIPIAPIQIVALSILSGSIYGALHHQFGIRECPHYYTLKKNYENGNVETHAIATHQLFIKSVVTGCLSTTSLSTWLGTILSTVSTLPCAHITISVPAVGIALLSLSLISLTASYTWSLLKKKNFKQDLENYQRLIGWQPSEENKDMTWWQLRQERTHLIEAKRQELSTNSTELAQFNQNLADLTTSIERNIDNASVPLKGLLGWKANQARDVGSYLVATAGSATLTTSFFIFRFFFN